MSKKNISKRVWDWLPWGESPQISDNDPVRERDEEELDKIVNATLVVGPGYARDLGQPQEGDMFVTPETVYRFENGRWNDLEVDTSWLIDHLKAYELPASDTA